MKIDPETLYGTHIVRSEVHVTLHWEPLTLKQRIMRPLWAAWDEWIYPSILLAGSITSFTIAFSAFERLFP